MQDPNRIAIKFTRSGREALQKLGLTAEDIRAEVKAALEALRERGLHARIKTIKVTGRLSNYAGLYWRDQELLEVNAAVAAALAFRYNPRDYIRGTIFHEAWHAADAARGLSYPIIGWDWASYYLLNPRELAAVYFAAARGGSEAERENWRRLTEAANRERYQPVAPREYIW